MTDSNSRLQEEVPPASTADAAGLGAHGGGSRAPLDFHDAVNIARGCTDYGGGHRTDGHYDAFQHGIQTVINALEAAEKRGLADTQAAALHRMGRTVAQCSCGANHWTGYTQSQALAIVGPDYGGHRLDGSSCWPLSNAVQPTPTARADE